MRPALKRITQNADYAEVSQKTLRDYNPPGLSSCLTAELAESLDEAKEKEVEGKDVV